MKCNYEEGRNGYNGYLRIARIETTASNREPGRYPNGFSGEEGLRDSSIIVILSPAVKTYVPRPDFFCGCCHLHYRIGLSRLLLLTIKKEEFAGQNYAEIITLNYWNIKVQF